MPFHIQEYYPQDSSLLGCNEEHPSINKFTAVKRSLFIKESVFHTSNFVLTRLNNKFVFSFNKFESKPFFQFNSSNFFVHQKFMYQKTLRMD